MENTIINVFSLYYTNSFLIEFEKKMIKKEILLEKKMFISIYKKIN